MIALLCTMLLGCQYGLGIKLIQNMEDKDISFQVHDNGSSLGINITSFTVYKCGDIKHGNYPAPEMAIWRVTSKNIEGGKMGSQIKYGSFSDVTITNIPPKPLANGGCYVVYAGASDKNGYPRLATMGFKLNAGGKAILMNESEYREVFIGSAG